MIQTTQQLREEGVPVRDVEELLVPRVARPVPSSIVEFGLLPIIRPFSSRPQAAAVRWNY
jgi:hypothetical protein